MELNSSFTLFYFYFFKKKVYARLFNEMIAAENESVNRNRSLLHRSTVKKQLTLILAFNKVQKKCFLHIRVVEIHKKSKLKKNVFPKNTKNQYIQRIFLFVLVTCLRATRKNLKALGV